MSDYIEIILRKIYDPLGRNAWIGADIAKANKAISAIEAFKVCGNCEIQGICEVEGASQSFMPGDTEFGCNCFTPTQKALDKAIFLLLIWIYKVRGNEKITEKED